MQEVLYLRNLFLHIKNLISLRYGTIRCDRCFQFTCDFKKFFSFCNAVAERLINKDGNPFFQKRESRFEMVFRVSVVNNKCINFTNHLQRVFYNIWYVPTFGSILCKLVSLTPNEESFYAREFFFDIK